MMEEEKTFARAIKLNEELNTSIKEIVETIPHNLALRKAVLTELSGIKRLIGMEQTVILAQAFEEEFRPIYGKTYIYTYSIDIHIVVDDLIKGLKKPRKWLLNNGCTLLGKRVSQNLGRIILELSYNETRIELHVIPSGQLCKAVKVTREVDVFELRCEDTKITEGDLNGETT
jgi:hypothetical protein